MRTVSKKKDGNLPGQISFTMLTSETPAEDKPKEKPRKTESAPVKKDTVAEKKRNQVPLLAKEVPVEMYQAAKELLEGYYRITAGILVNHLRISANKALAIMDRLQKDGLIMEDGKRVSQKGKKWGK
nr:hypothetical protein [Lachnoclostridium phocaeense]